MFTSLHTMARFAVLTFAGLSLLALTMAQLQPQTSVSATRENPWETLTVDAGEGRGEIHLVDRVSGETKVVMPPAAERWDFLAASPLRADDDSMEVVGRYASPVNDEANSPFGGTVGIVRVRLPKCEVLERLEMDVMPTGRPAWDPTGSGHVVFPGATGRLYSYRFSNEGSSTSSSIAPVEWRCDPPGGKDPFIVDPVWPRNPHFRNLVIVSLAPAKKLGERGPDLPLTPWWLELDQDCDAIVAAGPLFDKDDPLMTTPKMQVRYSNVVDRDGRLELIYLRHNPGQLSGSVCTAELELGEGLNRVHVRPGSAGPVSDCPITIGAMLPTIDARIAFTVPSLGRQTVTVALHRRPSDEVTQ
ncbi:hypothetical protein [Paludisphaera rhizosphaerae]|uniref:hypothetical protein n=1 Tax=Paludisphaera rhizosphaerae TaxID=2711216 RepID=UPI0013EC06CC|nr:hypothetical protein [Paludisphaera rhizosphaerae]